MIFFFGDTISKDASVVNYHAADPNRLEHQAPIPKPGCF